MAWEQYTCEISGKPAQVLIDQLFEKQAPVKELPRLSRFGVYCKEAPGSSLSSPNENHWRGQRALIAYIIENSFLTWIISIVY